MALYTQPHTPLPVLEYLPRWVTHYLQGCRVSLSCEAKPTSLSGLHWFCLWGPSRTSPHPLLQLAPQAIGAVATKLAPPHLKPPWCLDQPLRAKISTEYWFWGSEVRTAPQISPGSLAGLQCPPAHHQPGSLFLLAWILPFCTKTAGRGKAKIYLKQIQQILSQIHPLPAPES